MGHPPVSEIRRTMVDPSLKVFLSGVTHASAAKTVPARRSAYPQLALVWRYGTQA